MTVEEMMLEGLCEDCDQDCAKCYNLGYCIYDRERDDEEINELTTVLYEANHKKSVLDYHWLATEAYNAGYRKQKEGEWIYRENEFGNAYYACSICDCQTRYKENYCSNCGAKMKGGE